MIIWKIFFKTHLLLATDYEITNKILKKNLIPNIVAMYTCKLRWAEQPPKLEVFG